MMKTAGPLFTILGACASHLLCAVAIAGENPPRPFEEAAAQPVLVAPGVVTTGDDESHATLSRDGDTLYFLKNTPLFGFWTLVATKWRGNGWSRPQTLPFSGQYADADLAFAPNGTHAFFVSRRPVDGNSRSDTEIWKVAITPDGWGEPQHVANLSSPGDEWLPTFTEDGDMYFGSSRSGGLGGHDIWRSRRVDGVYQAPENLGAPVNSTGEEIEAFVTPDGGALIIAARNRGDELGAYDLYVSRLQDNGKWSEPLNPGAPVNSAAWDFAPRLSSDGRLFFFTSNRSVGLPDGKHRLDFDELERRIRAPGNGLRDIYVMRAESLWEAAQAKP